MSQRFVNNRRRSVALIDNDMTHARNNTVVRWRNESAEGPIECEAVPFERPVGVESQPRSGNLGWLPALLLVGVGALTALFALVGVTLVTRAGKMLASFSRPFLRSSRGGRSQENG